MLGIRTFERVELNFLGSLKRASRVAVESYEIYLKFNSKSDTLDNKN